MPEEILADLKSKGVILLEFIYVDYTGIARGKTMFIDAVGNRLTDGMGITKAMPASTMRDEIVAVEGMNAIGEYRLVPDLSSLRILPGGKVATVMCDYTTLEHEPCSFDGRVALKKVVAEYAELGYDIQMTYENEFTLFNQDEEGNWHPDDPEICFATESMERAYEFLPELVTNLKQVGIKPIEYYPEAGAGQHELPMAPTDPVTAADNEIWFKRIVKTTLKKYGLQTSFAPKPLVTSSGSGAHIHVSLWEGKRNAFFDSADKNQLSQVGYWFIGGVLHHLDALLALTCASENSYQRLQPSHWSSAYAIYGKDNREAALRIPSTFWSDMEASMNVELKTSDATANPYVAFAGLLAAGLDGIKNHIMPVAAADFDPATLSEQERQERGISRLPHDLATALRALEKDKLFAEMLSDIGLETYLKVKRADVTYLQGKSATEISKYYRQAY